MPYPKFIPKANRGRKKGRSCVVTSTPEKNALLEVLKIKEDKRLLVEKKRWKEQIKIKET